MLAWKRGFLFSMSRYDYCRRLAKASPFESWIARGMYGHNMQLTSSCLPGFFSTFLLSSFQTQYLDKCLQNALKSWSTPRSHKVTSCEPAMFSTYFKGPLALIQVFWFPAFPSASLWQQSLSSEVLGHIRTGRQNSTPTRSARILWPIPNLSLARSWL